MKIGILTFHCALNYGALLQTYGLQEYLKRQGHEVAVIDYRPEYLLRPYKVFNWSWKPTLSVVRNILFFIRAIWVLLIRWKRKRGFSRFIQKYINLCTMDFTDSDFDAYVFGSDQIWNPHITGGFDRIYFGRFLAAEGKKRVAYAASAGSVNLLIPLEEKLAISLSSYTAISVREKSLANFVNRYMQAEVVLDPVLLAGRETFEKIASQEKAKKDYLLVFQLDYDDIFTVRKIAEAIAQKQRLEVVELVSSSESLRNRRLITTASPERVISLFRDASHVVTTSYHGTAFSVLFEKDFHVVHSSGSERMANLLSALGLEERLIDSETDITSDKIDYEQVNRRLEKMHLDSVAFLTDALA